MAGIGSQGTVVEHSSGSPSVWAAIEGVTSISGPSGTAATIDVTDLQSTGKEFIPGLADFGEITLEVNWRGAAEQLVLLDMFSNSTEAEEFRLRIPTTAARTTFHVFRFDASVTAYSFGVGVDDKVTASITLRTSGAMDYVGTV